MVLPLTQRPEQRTVSKGSAVSLEVLSGEPLLGGREEHQGCYGGLCASLGCEGSPVSLTPRPTKICGFLARWGLAF